LTLFEDGHGTWDSDGSSAEQIIGHHNGVLRTFASLKEAEGVSRVKGPDSRTKKSPAVNVMFTAGLLSLYK
jgi:hypothetical protein